MRGGAGSGVRRLGICGALLAGIWGGAACPAAERPNVLVILVDDLGRQDLAIEGSAFHETPHIDALARRAVRFSRAYSACQVCSPSRAALQTGKAPARLGITDYIAVNGGNQPAQWKRNTRLLPAAYRPELPLEEVTIAEALREAGYHTFFAGKWHLGGEGFAPEDQGYDVNKGGWHFGTPPGGFFAPYRNPKLGDDPPGTELPLRLGRETAAFIREAAAGDAPFFAMLSFYSVHAPIQCAEARWRTFRDKAERMGLTDRAAPRFVLDRAQEVRQVQDHPVYAGMIAALDDAVGLALNALREAGLEDDTIVVFTSDNGGVSSGDGFATSCLPFRGGKGRQWEGGIRQPFYIAGPGIEGGRTTDYPAIGMDLYPTILDLVGLPPRPEQHCDGTSLAPALRGTLPDGAAAERTLFWHYPHYGNQGGEPSAIVTRGDWKLIHYFEDGRDELYDIRRDVGEQEDLAARHPDRVSTLRSALEAWQREVAAVPPTPNPGFSIERAAAEERQRIDVVMPKREAEHARFLAPDYVPAGGWWDDPARGQERGPKAAARRSQANAAAPQPASRPNIIVITVDDLGYADIGPFGSTKHRTPHLDRMAREGRRLTSFYAAPVCSPSRAALMTGCHPKRALPIPHVLFPVAATGLAPEEVTIAEVLASAGYATAAVGKWHLGDQPPFLPTRQGFDHYYGIPYSNDMGTAADGSKSDLGRPIPELKPNARGGGDEYGLRGFAQPPLPFLEDERLLFRVAQPQQQAIVRLLTDRALAFIRRHAAEPFFLYLPHTAVHFPLYPGQAFAGRSPHGLYADWVEEVDWSVGQVLDAVRTAGIAERTLVLFTSDNGGTQRGSNAPLKGHKGSTWEGGVRVCTVAWWPGTVPAGTASDAISGNIDVLPTAAALAGVPLPEGRAIDGRDLRGVLTGSDASGPHETYPHFRGLELQALRHGTWKWHRNEGTLYDLEADIGESRDVAAEHPDVVARIRELVAEIDADLGITGIGPGCRPLGRVESPRAWIAPDR